MKRAIPLLALTAVVLTAVGCASGGPKQEKVDRMALVEDHLARLAADITVLQRGNRTTSEQVEALAKEIRKLTEESKAESARLSVQLDGIDGRLQSLAERVEDSELRIGNLRKELNGLRYSSYSTRPYEGQPEGEPTDETTDAGGNPAGETGQPGVTLPADEAGAYQMAYADFLKGEYGLALTGLRQFLQSFPGAEKADDAQFHIGECLYNLGDYQTAVEAYDAVIQRYPDSQYVVSATYKKALSFLNGNQTAQGVILLQQLIINYPDSNEARLSREKLRSLGLNP